MSKRGENIYKRKDGRWEGRLRQPNGKYHYVYGKSYTEIKKKIRDKLTPTDDLHDNKNISEQRIVEKLDMWLDECSKRVKPSTYENYYYCMKTYVYPYFNKNKTITKADLEKFVEQICKNHSLSCSYQNKILTIFKVALRSIMIDDISKTQLLNLIKMPKGQTKMIQVFSFKEQRKIEKELINDGSIKAIGILLCLYTGLRLGELGAIRWSHVDLVAKTITITGTLYRKKNFDEENGKTGLYISSPKNRSSNRCIPLPCFLADMLKRHATKVCIDNDAFLLSSEIKPMEPRTLQRFYQNILKRADVKYRKFHTIRHTFATRALEMGVDVKTVSELLGHATVTTTLNIYAHSLMEQKKKAIAKLSTLYCF